MGFGVVGSRVFAVLMLAVLAGSAGITAASSDSEVVRGEPRVPGDYSGPDASAVPPGWFGWSRGGDDSHKQCGKVKLVFRNPDLQEDADGWVHAQGQFFIQFQAVGPGSATVARFAFSFGVTAEPLDQNPVFNCNQGLPDGPAGKGTAGIYLLYYRSDWDAKDGFFVPIQTRNVPDGDYAAAVHAYDATGNEIARGWAKAKVKNCNGPSGPSSTCPADTQATVNANDRTMPWPIVLPGDGEQTNPGVNGLTIEFAEPMINDTVKAYVNGLPVPLVRWEPPERDDDLQPNNDNQACTVKLRAVCTRQVYGPGYQWSGGIAVGDVIRVEGRDQNRNLMVKTMHYGLGTSGGTVELEKPDVDLNPLNGDIVEIRPGDAHEFNVRLVNIGGNDAHVNLLANYTEEKGLRVAWASLDGTVTTHVIVPMGKSVEAKLRADAAQDMKPFLFKVNAIAEYDVKGEQVRKSLLYTVNVNPNAGDGHAHLHTQGLDPVAAGVGGAGNETLSATSGKGSPGVGFAAAATVLAGLAIVFARRPGGRQDRL